MRGLEAAAHPWRYLVEARVVEGGVHINALNVLHPERSGVTDKPASLSGFCCRASTDLLPECRSSILATSPTASRKSPVYSTFPRQPSNRNLEATPLLSAAYSAFTVKCTKPTGIFCPRFCLSGRKPTAGSHFGGNTKRVPGYNFPDQILETHLSFLTYKGDLNFAKKFFLIRY